MEKDSLFLIGDSHTVCQDYALVGNDRGIDFLIISDGCSSSKDTDVGARILCLIAKDFIGSTMFNNRYRLEDRYTDFGHVVIRNARSSALSLGLDCGQALDATLIVCATDGERVIVFAYGDGNIIYHPWGAEPVCTNIHYESGAPYYLSYWGDKGRQKAYHDLFDAPLYLDYGAFKHTFKYNDPFTLEYQLESVSSMTICSDGLESFVQKPGCSSVNFRDLVPSMVGFKNIKGEFLKRRVDRHCADLKKCGIVHNDDLGMASMVFENRRDYNEVPY